MKDGVIVCEIGIRVREACVKQFAVLGIQRAFYLTIIELELADCPKTKKVW